MEEDPEPTVRHFDTVGAIELAHRIHLDAGLCEDREKGAVAEAEVAGRLADSIPDVTNLLC